MLNVTKIKAVCCLRLLCHFTDNTDLLSGVRRENRKPPKERKHLLAHSGSQTMTGIQMK